MSAATYLVVSCTERKRAAVPEGLRLRSIAAAPGVRRVEAWWQRLARAKGGGRYPAAELYGGEHFAVVLRAFAALRRLGPRASLWIASAGYGLVSASALLAPYSATFVAGSPDSVALGDGSSHVAQKQAWWAALAGYAGPEAGAPRSLCQLARQAPLATLLIVAAPHYIRALRIDLLAARSEMRDSGRLIVISNWVLLADRELAPHLIPVDERCQTMVGGTMLGLNARVALRLLEEGHEGPLTAAYLRERYDIMASDAEKPPKYNRERMNDEDVVKFLRTELERDPRAAWTLLLRRLRSDGQACEQGRFRDLHRQVREAIDSGGRELYRD